MQKLKDYAPGYVMILFEIIAGIMLIAAPQIFTTAIIICFGILMLIIGIVYLVRYLQDKKNLGEAAWYNLIIAIITLVIGCICTFLSRWIMGLFALIAVFYGIMLIVSGILKIKEYSGARKSGISVSPLALISAILSLILGIIIAINPFSAVNTLWVFAGLVLLVEAVIDIAALITSRKKA